jgi:succinate dehydrogenase/fumarate reductase flavoprotein subunit
MKTLASTGGEYVERSKQSLSRRIFAKTAVGALGMSALPGREANAADEIKPPRRWDTETDVVVVGAGATGLPAAIMAREEGAAAILIDANFDVGGHAILTGGKIALGGGTSAQRQEGIEDSPDRVFADLTDWSVVEPNGFPDYRYNDREIIRAFADNCAATFEWLLAHGVMLQRERREQSDQVYSQSVNATGKSVPREHLVVAMSWPLVQTGMPARPELGPSTPSGVGLVRPLEASARKLGVKILLEHKMTTLVRDTGRSGRVRGIEASHKGQVVNIRARRGIVIATGGHSTNVNFRRIFDPRLTEEYPVAGSPYSLQDASGELAAMAIGASLWGAYNQTGEFGRNIVKPGRIGTEHGYGPLIWLPTSPLFHLVRAVGLAVRDYQNVILVNQAGARFYDETKGDFAPGTYNSTRPYVTGSYQNAAGVRYSPDNFVNAALAGTDGAKNGGGPIWAIFDSDAVQREGWIVEPPDVDVEGGFFFSGRTIGELAQNIINKYQRNPLPGSELEKTVTKYNSFVAAGRDPDFGKPNPMYRIETPPFYAAWATPLVHDTRSGLRITPRCEVVDTEGNVIPGLFCGGESAGGFSMHGLTRCITQGRIAGREAARATT